MPKKTEMAETFYAPAPGEFVADFIARHKRLAPWKRHSVAVMLFSPARDKVALCLPRKVLEREREDRIRVPLQGRLSGPLINPLEDARKIVAEKAGLELHIRDFSYLGFGFTRSFRNTESVVPFNKLLHVVQCAVVHERRLRSETPYAAHIDWFHLDALPGIAASSMDERKAWVFFKALESAAAQHTPYAPRLRNAVAVK